MRETSILVVEDEPSIAEVVSLYLKRAGYRVLLARDGLAALQLMERQMPDLLILDLMLPKVDGYEIARWVRGQGDTPIIILTARREEYDRIAGLEMGADDYVVKPFSPQELVSRVRAVLRRTRRGLEAAGERPLDFGDVTIDPQTHLVTVAGKEVALTAVEFDMLWLMAQNPRRVFSRQQLLERVWGQSEYIDPGTVTVHVRRLREKIERDPSNPEHIVTLWGVGYKFEP
jgi:two-component system OmpR family response regulator/two-component system alkaline phosphatase synthesis response regulator PhoP